MTAWGCAGLSDSAQPLQFSPPTRGNLLWTVTTQPNQVYPRVRGTARSTLLTTARPMIIVRFMAF